MRFLANNRYEYAAAKNTLEELNRDDCAYDYEARDRSRTIIVKNVSAETERFLREDFKNALERLRA